MFVFIGESSFQDFLGGAGFRPPTVSLLVAVTSPLSWPGTFAVVLNGFQLLAPMSLQRVAPHPERVEVALLEIGVANFGLGRTHFKTWKDLADVPSFFLFLFAILPPATAYFV